MPKNVPFNARPMDVPSIMVFHFGSYSDASHFFSSDEVDALKIQPGEEGTWGVEPVFVTEHDVEIRFRPPLSPTTKFKSAESCLSAFCAANACIEAELKMHKKECLDTKTPLDHEWVKTFWSADLELDEAPCEVNPEMSVLHGKDLLIRTLVDFAEKHPSYQGAEEMPCPFTIPQINRSSEFDDQPSNLLYFPIPTISPEPLEG